VIRVGRRTPARWPSFAALWNFFTGQPAPERVINGVRKFNFAHRQFGWKIKPHQKGGRMRTRRTWLAGIYGVALLGAGIALAVVTVAAARGRSLAHTGTRAQAQSQTQAQAPAEATPQAQTKMQAPGQSKPHIDVPTIPARPEDVSSLEAIVRADYECISGAVGVPRQWSRDFSLYDPNGRFFVITKDAKSGEPKISSLSLQEFTDETDAELVKDGFVEHELAHKIYRYGNVATVFSSYEGKISSTGEVAGRGVNIYQAYFAAGRWWISSVSWDARREINDIPPDLQPAK
jgi:hypothetical protein